MAFPNAYVDVDEPRNPAFRNKALAIVAAVGVVLFAATILVLHLEPTGYDPWTQAVSDYAVGAFSVQMQFAFFAGGVGVLALGCVSYLTSSGRRDGAGSLLLLVSGVSLFMVGLFPTDIEVAPATVHGNIHVLLSAVVFLASPVGMLLVSSKISRPWTVATLLAIAAAVTFAAVEPILNLDAAGAAERVYIAVMAVWWLAASLRVLRSR